MQSRHFDLGGGLHARPASRNDAEALVDLVCRNIEHLGRYLPPVAETVSLEKAARYFDLVDQQIAEGCLMDWHLFQENVLCGEIRLNHIETEFRKAAVGYFLDARCCGQGIISRALARIIAYAFDELNFNRIELRCTTGNAPSRRIAERAGFLLEGRLRQSSRLGEGFQDDYVFGLLACDYAARRAAQEQRVSVKA
jgi:ribosomal-protein-serine acetyltransferase